MAANMWNSKRPVRLDVSTAWSSTMTSTFLVSIFCVICVRLRAEENETPDSAVSGIQRHRYGTTDRVNEGGGRRFEMSEAEG